MLNECFLLFQSLALLFNVVMVCFIGNRLYEAQKETVTALWVLRDLINNLKSKGGVEAAAGGSENALCSTAFVEVGKTGTV